MRRAPDLDTIGGRLQAERQRMGLSQPAFAALCGSSRSAQISWEKGLTSPNAAALATFNAAGGDALFIITGHRTTVSAETGQPSLRDAVRAMLALVPADQRVELLLDLISEARAKS